ncbi:MAG: hypothetical protein Q7R35_17560 [Elusimicrobiota bacterium]|nr:hypothetical protein [Elusimicrobiota bacterium]
MKKLLKIISITLAVLAVLAGAIVVKVLPELPALLFYKAKSVFVKPPPPEKTLSRIEAYGFAPGSRLEDRITIMPPALLEHYRSWDKAPEYESYSPSAADKALLLGYFKLLPPIYRNVFEARCLGIFFMKNLKGNGITTWAVDAAQNIYFHITLNPASLTADLSATLSAREASCFIPDGKSSVTVDTGKKYKGLLYGLFHEATHAVDYVKGVTPWADDTMPLSLRPSETLAHDFFMIIWKHFSIPQPAADYLLRDKITFYGLNNGPKIPFSEAPRLYAGLNGSPFPSLYGSMSWAEDFAELVTLSIITRDLGQPYKITLRGPGKPIVLEPLRSKSVKTSAAMVMKVLEYLQMDEKL